MFHDKTRVTVRIFGDDQERDMIGFPDEFGVLSGMLTPIDEDAWLLYQDLARVTGDTRVALIQRPVDLKSQLGHEKVFGDWRNIESYPSRNLKRQGWMRDRESYDDHLVFSIEDTWDEIRSDVMPGTRGMDAPITLRPIELLPDQYFTVGDSGMWGVYHDDNQQDAMTYFGAHRSLEKIVHRHVVEYGYNEYLNLAHLESNELFDFLRP